MKKMIKRIVFALIIVSLVLVTGVVIKTGKFEKLEGYMYAFAAGITNSATDCNATSSNATSSDAQECATSSNATSSNATSSNATSSNATSSNTTSSNTTSSNTTSSNTQTNTEPSIPVTTEPEEVQTDLTYNNSEITQDTLNNISNSTQIQNMKEKEYAVTTSGNTEVKKEVSFLESHKMYIMIIGVSLLAIVIVAIILIVDKKAIAKRKAKANNNEGKIE